MSMITQWMGNEPAVLRGALQEGGGQWLRWRRGIVGVSLLGIGAMAATTMLQMGLVKRLPDLPMENSDTKEANSGDETYGYGGPDSPIAIRAHGLNLVLASTGGADRCNCHPWLPLLAAVIAATQAGSAAKYLFYTMPKAEKAWGPYRVVDALVHLATVALTLPEARAAARRLANRR